MSESRGSRRGVSRLDTVTTAEMQISGRALAEQN